MPHLGPLAFAILTLADPPAASPSPLEIVEAVETALGDAIARAEPSVVAIARVAKSASGETTAIRRPGGGIRRDLPPESPEEVDVSALNYFALDYGAGVVIGDHGEIVTAFHVVRGASRIRVRALAAKEFDAEVIAADPRSDLAVIAPIVSAEVPAPVLKPIPLGDATKLHVGSFLLALGNPYNAASDGRASASWGILSNVARRIDPPPLQGRFDEDRMPRELRYYPTLIQLDSKLNLGMSGGAVINVKGELVGLTTTSGNTAGFDVQAGYAIPVDALGRRVIETLKQGKEVEYGFLGVALDETMTNRITTVLALISNEAGLLTGDTIIGVGDVPVTDSESLTLAISAYAAGQPVKLRVRRGDGVVLKSVTLSKFPVKGEVIATNRPAPWRGLRVDYPSVLARGTIGDNLHIAIAKGGVGVTEVVPGSPAEAAGLKEGQVITRVDGKPVRTPADFAKAVADRHQGDLTLETDSGTVVVK